MYYIFYCQFSLNVYYIIRTFFVMQCFRIVLMFTLNEYPWVRPSTLVVVTSDFRQQSDHVCWNFGSRFASGMSPL
jgi:hypothetical protein